MMKRWIIVAFFIFSFIFFGILLWRGNEDTWICDQGEWIKHGHPQIPQPTIPCIYK